MVVVLTAMLWRLWWVGRVVEVVVVEMVLDTCGGGGNRPWCDSDGIRWLCWWFGCGDGDW